MTKPTKSLRKENFEYIVNQERNLPKKSTKKLSEKKSQRLQLLETWGEDSRANPNAKEDFEELLKEMIKPRKK